MHLRSGPCFFSFILLLFFVSLGLRGVFFPCYRFTSGIVFIVWGSVFSFTFFSFAPLPFSSCIIFLQKRFFSFAMWRPIFVNLGFDDFFSFALFVLCLSALLWGVFFLCDLVA